MALQKRKRGSSSGAGSSSDPHPVGDDPSPPEPPNKKARVEELSGDFHDKFVAFCEGEMGYTNSFADEMAALVMARAYERKEEAFQPYFKKQHFS